MEDNNNNTRKCKLESCQNQIDSSERKNKVFCSDSCKNKYYNSFNKGVKQTWDNVIQLFNSIKTRGMSFEKWLTENYYPPKQKKPKTK